MHDQLGGRTMLHDPIGGRISVDEQIEQAIVALVPDEYPHCRDPEREPVMRTLIGLDGAPEF